MHHASFSSQNHLPPIQLYTLSLHDALPISPRRTPWVVWAGRRTSLRWCGSCCPTKRRGSPARPSRSTARSEEHTSELQSQFHLVCRLLPEKKTVQSERDCQESKRESTRDVW